MSSDRARSKSPCRGNWSAIPTSPRSGYLRVVADAVSRAFVKEDDHEQEPEYRLPDPESPYYIEAAAWALIQGADAGNSRSAEVATGYDWGDAALEAEVEKILEQAERDGHDRVGQLARRFLTASRTSE